MFWNSIFDQPAGQEADAKLLWQKADGQEKMIHASNDVIYEGFLLKGYSTKGKQSERYFVLTTERLYLFRKKYGGVKGFIDIRFARILHGSVLQSGEQETCPNSTNLTIRLVKNLKYYELIAKNEDDKSKWIAALAKVAVRSDFHTQYKVISVIGKGSFAKIYNAKNTTTGQIVAVKAFSKEEINRTADGPEALKIEIEVLYTLKHSSIIALYEVHETKHSLYFTCDIQIHTFITDRIKEFI